MTADLDYPRLLALADAFDPGVILFRDGEWSDEEVVEKVEHLLGALGEMDLGQSMIVVERNRIRRRRLPLRQRG